MTYLSLEPGQLKTAQFHQYLLGAIAPRPICFASTVDADGNPNLSPFSFFNVFGSKPPIMVFSPARRVRDNTLKHTLENIRETGEVVINVVNYAMVQQMSLSSCEYPKGTNEFIKAGFTPLTSALVKPFRVAESPAQFECRVLQVIETGTEGGAGNLVVAEVLKMHIQEAVLNEKQQIDPHKIDLVARMGGDYYCRASGEAVFEVAKPNQQLGIGVDALPDWVRLSTELRGNQLGQLGNISEVPSPDPSFTFDRLRSWESQVMEYLDEGKVAEAWQIIVHTSAREGSANQD